MTVTSELVDIYCRSAAEDGNTLAAQEAACRQFAEDAGFRVGMVYAEIASGMRLEREKLALLRTRYTGGEIQGVVVMMLDRLSRHVPDFLLLQEEMRAHTVTLHCVKETGEEDLFRSVLARVTGHQYREER